MKTTSYFNNGWKSIIHTFIGIFLLLMGWMNTVAAQNLPANVEIRSSTSCGDDIYFETYDSQMGQYRYFFVSGNTVVEIPMANESNAITKNICTNECYLIIGGKLHIFDGTDLIEIPSPDGAFFERMDDCGGECVLSYRSFNPLTLFLYTLDGVSLTPIYSPIQGFLKS